MPKRSSDFQRLITLIERGLAGDARVEEPAELVDALYSRKREVDVLVTGPVGSHPVRVGVETRDHKRRQGVKWIDDIVGKYRDLPVDKIVAVSKSGFTKTAIERAQKLGIITLTLDQAEGHNWREELLVDELEYTAIAMRMENFMFDVPEDARGLVESDYVQKAQPEQITLFWPDGTERRLVDAVNDQLGSQALVASMFKHATPGGTLRHEISITPKTSLEIGFGDGPRMPLISARCNVVSDSIRHISAPTQHSAYGEAQVAHGSVTLDDAAITVALVSDAALKRTLHIDERKKGS